MGAYTVIPQDAFDTLQLDAGILLKDFNPANPSTVSDSNIICATTGGINISCVPTFSDLAEDVDNAPNGMLEMKHLDSWECKIGFTALTVSTDVIALALGASTVSGNKIVPNRNLNTSDFDDLWWVGDMADGGFACVKLLNALSTSGLTLQTTKNGKGQITCELTGHVSIDNQNVMPMEFYVVEGANGNT